MFLKPQILKRLMKKAYKSSGLVIGNTGTQYFLQGGSWRFLCNKEYVPKTILAQIIELAGELPDKGECFSANKDGNQMEMNPMEVEVPNGAEEIEISDLILLGKSGNPQRVLQFKMTGHIYLVNDTYIQMIDKNECDFDDGETAPGEPYCHTDHGVFFCNGTMTLQILFRVDDFHVKLLDSLKNFDLTDKEKTE